MCRRSVKCPQHTDDQRLAVRSALLQSVAVISSALDSLRFVFGRPFVKRFALCCRTIFSRNVGVLWPNSWMDQDTTWYGGSPRPKRHCFTWGPSSPPSRKGAQQPPPTFQSMAIVAKWLDGSFRIQLGTEVGLGQGDIVLDGDPAPQKLVQ